MDSAERTLTLSARMLRAGGGPADVIGIAYGLAKVPAASAGIRGGYLTSLVTHADFARRLLNAGEKPHPATSVCGVLMPRHVCAAELA